MDWSLASGSASAHPDFSSQGSAITFGLLTDIYFNAGTGTVVGGIDNWTINVFASPIPEPGAAGLALALPLLLLRRKRAVLG